MTQNTISLRPTRLQPVKQWPRSLPTLEPTHFAHGSWTGEIDEFIEYGIEPSVGTEVENLDHKLSKLITCGTPRCAVGNVLSAFGLDCRYRAWRGSALEDQVASGEGPVGEFVAKYASRLSGENYDKCSLWQLSDIFEGDNSSDIFEGDNSTPISAVKAARDWNDTLIELGYTEEVYR